MLEFIDIGVPGVVAYRLEGKTTTEDMKAVLNRFRQVIDRGEKINLYQEITSLGGVELEALGEKMKFFLDAGLSNFGKVAVVATAGLDSSLERYMWQESSAGPAISFLF